ncbi:TetR/AcrR family transcriptional regulator [Alteromonas sp. C1M14]|uniref:TetR/AcrR family transcriptional regulator n=1 Tax=Alteromonas sp. C1M14 TaxID=2841567 RepID=UPI001C09AB12|nr:TetR/AcrR family transcriptional regulator [Alteromonas sp. C1M14]MBU2978865.1 TetR/AcrR family transcriptional regulator [Alteromonas sp. C1M14]
MRYTDEVVIEKATRLFWQKGYLAVGMRELQSALDMRPGSIYNRFKSKDGLFCQVIQAYVVRSENELLAVAQSATPLAALKHYFVTTLTASADHVHQRQCLLIKTLAEIDSVNADTRFVLSEGMKTLKQAFIQVVEQLVHAHEIPRGMECEKVATWLQSQFIGLRTFSLITQDDIQVSQLIEKTLVDLQGPWPVTAH